jgi:4-amino-4-deoxy-L-arabinose transferase-like glycosyltransferase
LKIVKAPIDRILQTQISSQFSFGKDSLKRLLSENYPLLSILIGFMLVALSIGPYYNGDTAWEYDAVLGVINYGLPYTNGFYLMDQPPLGFYTQAAFMKAFGVSISNGVFLVTLFGLGCVALVYGIGKVMYNKTTGLFAAALFAFSPWHIILSRSFLIDVQCLFFSLFSLFVGILAIRRSSLGLFFVSGILFTVAFNTKLYVVFTLIPLIVLFLYNRPGLKRTLSWLAVFSAPVLLFYYLWYQTISGLGVTSIFGHTDFMVHNVSTVVPSFWFIGNFLTAYALGWFFVDAAIISVLVCLVQRRLFHRFLAFDLICVVVIVLVLCIDLYLGAALNLKAPYLNAIKYNYHTLPYFSFLAASLVTKSLYLLKLTNPKRKLVMSFVAVAGLALVAAALLYNMHFVNLFSTWDYLIFRVEPTVDVGYSFFTYTLPIQDNLLMSIKYAGFAVALSGLAWASRHKINLALKRLFRKPLSN